MNDTRNQTPKLSSATISFVAGVVMLGVFCTVLYLLSEPVPPARVVILWLAAFLASEVLRFRTPTGKGNVSMASTIHIAALPIVGLSGLLPAVWVSRLAADLIFHRLTWYRGLFNAAQVALAVTGASLLFSHFAPAGLSLKDPGSFMGLFAPMAAASAIYYFINTGLVSGVLALSLGMPYPQAWRENFGYRVEIVSRLAMFLLAPVVAIMYQMVGVWGFAAFLFPVLLIRDACERYIALEKAQRVLIGSERLAAKGEMAASVGHELNNYLQVIAGNIQLFMRKQDNLSEEQRERLEKINQQAHNMSTLSKGLMDFSHLESKFAPTDLCALVNETVNFIRPQNRFDKVMILTEMDSRVGLVNVDPAQIQQVLTNLFFNSADAMREAGCQQGQIVLRIDYLAAREVVCLTLTDTGPGLPEDVRHHIFEPGFTTREDGHGFGLSTVFRIVQNHNGFIFAENAPDGGAQFRIQIPARSARPRSAA